MYVEIIYATLRLYSGEMRFFHIIDDISLGRLKHSEMAYLLPFVFMKGFSS